MGKKNKSNLGRALIKDRFAGSRGKKFVSNTMLHTTEIQDGYDWGRLNLQSVTDESSFQEFLSTAELAGREFQAEKMNMRILNPFSTEGVLSKDEINKIKSAQIMHKDFIKIPRRPKWDSTVTPEQLDLLEKECFLNWRRSLAKLQEEEGVLLTPYEKNLEFWRQLWRVVEKSDVVLQIVDARNPLLFRCEDLELYVKEVSDNKMNMLLINKSDFLTEKQREYWADYFNSVGLRIVFYSALEANEENSAKTESVSSSVDKDHNDESDKHDYDESNEQDCERIKTDIKDLEELVEESAKKLEELNKQIEELVSLEDQSEVINTSKLYSKQELIELFRTIHTGPKVTENISTIGLTGYPNVGKSSTINSLLSAKKVSVSATPGKTKHFQTLYLEKDILLCDCPGLVMPSFVFTKAEMILNGILPIDQMRDHIPPINLLTSYIPRHILEEKYGIMLPPPTECEDPNIAPTSPELLDTYGTMRGFMTANGQPDNARAARYILKDFVNGKLRYCLAPPNVDQNEFHTWPEPKKKIVDNKMLSPKQGPRIEEFGKNDFDKSSVAHGSSSTLNYRGAIMSNKPWRNKNKEAKKKVKGRIKFAHLDQH